ncbi:mitochondrial protein [Coprinopsis cinerea okayama7|uniref:Mitochondrial protein n=1 Tax=Coprinopsis cinerea (strain Okayama-7 / 130 / ATCC MYA-4618 / FGSC 9003) TaxID=240176 RepID=D6RMQ9_COPC7|nr:mitochondrial protein [Coprinopsis cinerea okayama7\|eukprot:XP_002911186.1 mitochondrial protein [Coprinopsis cinerea okayama7\
MPNLPKPLHVYSYPTPNGLSVPIYLNELKRVYPNLDYDFTNIDSEEGVKQVPWFVNVNPNASIPALVDVKRGNFAVFETSAILLYIAQHYDPDYHFWFSSSEDPDDYSQMLQWLFWAVSDLFVFLWSSPSYTSPPFNTHAFFTALERTFPESTARSLMRATRALLVDRIGRVRREGLTQKDLDNQAYLFRAALSELRAEITMMTKNDSAAIRSATAALRREVDRLDVKMKEDIANLKHEIQMELDTRKNEAKTEQKQMSIAIEELLNKSVVTVSDLRTDVEEAKWEIMRIAVLTLAGFVLAIIVGMEIKPRPPPTPNQPPSPPPRIESRDAPVEGFEKSDYLT